MPQALITGITGQDGFFLTQILLSQGIEVVGTTLNANSEKSKSFLNRFPQVKIYETSNSISDQFRFIFSQHNPKYIFNLASISSVSKSFTDPKKTQFVNCEYFEELLRSVLKFGHPERTRIVQASSSEMYGDTAALSCDELTEFLPVSPYGQSKLEAHKVSMSYRNRYEMLISNAILFNHESELRSDSFVIKKICKYANAARLGLNDPLVVANKEIERDWGFAGDYAQAMQLMITADLPSDYVVATGVGTQVREVVRLALEIVGIRYDENLHIQEDVHMRRPHDPIRLVGNPTKIWADLGWRSTMPLKKTLERIIIASRHN